MSRGEFDVSSLSPEAYCSLVVDQTLASTVEALGAEALSATLEQIDNDERLTGVGAARGIRELEEYIDIYPVMPIGDIIETELRRYPTTADNAEVYLKRRDWMISEYAKRLADGHPYPFLPLRYRSDFDFGGYDPRAAKENIPIIAETYRKRGPRVTGPDPNDPNF
jgi:hypothetical protein